MSLIVDRARTQDWRMPVVTEAERQVQETLAGPGTPLDPRTRRTMEARLGQDFARVQVHSGSDAVASARAIDALAYTAGHHVVMGSAFAADSAARSRLLAHELAHVGQQTGAGDNPAALSVVNHAGHETEAHAAAEGRPTTLTPAAHAIARAPTSIGTKFTNPTGPKTTLKSVHAEFDGATFTVFESKKAILSHPAQSGKPVTVRPSDVTMCKGSPTDSYLNNPRYVGIKDFGPIPEGEFLFRSSAFATFTGAEQLTMITGGMYVDPFGTPLHGGDWGSGRAPLRPTKILPAPKGCGNTAARSGFYLHGGSLPGSSGCIDIDNDGIDGLLKLIAGYGKDIPVKVAYTAPPPSVGQTTRRLGGFTYPTDDKGQPIKDPSIWDRLRGATQE